MVRMLGAFAFIGLTALVGACGVGDEKPPSDDRDKNLMIDCNASFKTTGTFVAGTPGRPSDVQGCWPVGTWTFSATVDQNECTDTPTLAGSYSFRVDRAVDSNPNNDIGYVESYTWISGVDKSLVHKIGVSEIASGCQGGIEIFNADKTVFWNFRPLLQDDNSIVGFGDYAEYSEPQSF